MNPTILPDLLVRIAQTEEEIKRAQELRYRVFYEGMGAVPRFSIKAEKRDFDIFDDYCDQLLVIDRSKSTFFKTCVVGTYRLLRKSVALQKDGYYSTGEFEVGKMSRNLGEHVELGRSCVDPEYRGRAIMQLLWQGIASYIAEHDITLMFGCASFPGTNLDEMASALSYLHHNHLAPESWRPKAQSSRYVGIDLLEENSIDMRTAMRQMPALIKGYLRVGGMIGEGAVIDHEFNTTDICLIVETENITGRYQRHYLQPQNFENSQLSA